MKSHEDALVFAYSLFHRIAEDLSEKSWWGGIMNLTQTSLRKKRYTLSQKNATVF